MKKFTQKILSVLLALVTVVSMIMVMPMTANAANYFIKRIDAPDRATFSKDNNFPSSYKEENGIYHDGNCTWYAFAREREILGYAPPVKSGDAGTWQQQYKNLGYNISTTPKLGSIACNGGHVAIVEEIYDDGTFLISESNYNRKYFNTRISTASEWTGFVVLENFQPMPIKSANIGNDVIFSIQGQSSGKNIDISGWGKGDGAKVQIWDAYPQLNQMFRFNRQSDGTYVITALHSGKVLDVKGGNKDKGTLVWQHSENGSDAQRWYIIDCGGGCYKFVSKLSGKVLDVSGNKTDNGTQIQVWDDNGSSAQRFKLYNQTSYPTVNNGTYAVKGKGSNKYLDIRDRSKNNGAVLQIWE